MGEVTKISWTDATWNPMTGCDNSFNCWDRCYARKMHMRFNKKAGEDYFKPTFHLKRLSTPGKWKKPKIIFVCSLGDLFAKDMDLDATIQIFTVMKNTPRHRYLVLTKRPDRMRSFLHFLSGVEDFRGILPLKNVFLGVSVCRQEDIYRIPILLSCASDMHFVSMEPLLGKVDIFPYLGCNRNHLDWVIVGGESGADARPMNPEWAKHIQKQCQAYNIAFFFKQWGTWLPVGEPLQNVPLFEKVGKDRAGHLLEGKTIQEFPCILK